MVHGKSQNFHEKGAQKDVIHASGVTIAPIIGHFANTVIWKKGTPLLLFSIGYFSTDVIWALLKRSGGCIVNLMVGTKQRFFTIRPKLLLS